MMTDDDVENLYRCLLRRAPETSDTIAAFKAYYGDFDRGQAAILQSAEFATLFAGLAGAAQPKLAHGFLKRIGGAAAPDRRPANAELAGTMRLMVRSHGHVHLAVVVGEGEARLTDLLPLETAHAAVLHVAPYFPSFMPQVGELPGGASLFRIRLDAASLAEFLLSCDLRIDLLVILRDAPYWLESLREVVAERAILIGGAEIEAATESWRDVERVVPVGTLLACMRGGWFLPVRYAPPPVDPPVVEPECALWLATIMRNEAGCIVNMLRSAAPIVTGFVLVDTGSTDNSMALARECLVELGKPFVLSECACARFDDMRNDALGMVPAEAEWVLMLDADEELCVEDFAPLLALLATNTHDAYALPRYNYLGHDKDGEVAPYPDRQVRLLRHGCKPPIRYSGAVHEKVLNADIGRVPLNATVLGRDVGGPHIHHLVRRFRSAEAEARKQAHYRAIAETYEDRKEGLLS